MSKFPLYILIFFLGAGMGGTAWLLLSTAGLPIELDKPPAMVSFSSSAKCPYFLKANPALQNPEDVAATTVTFPPEVITNPSATVTGQESTFNINSRVFEGEELVQFPGRPRWQQRQADVDGDGQPETILFGNTAMNHTPHIALIVKQGKIIFKAMGTSLDITDIQSGSFIFHRTNDWLTGDDEKIFYRLDNGVFLPVWRQRSCGIQVTQ